MSRLRFVLLAAGGMTLLVGLWLGLVRMGIPLPVRALAPMDHGPLMVSGFLGTVIAMERAVAMRKPWGYLAPLFNAVGGVVTLFTASVLGPVLMTAGSAVVVAMLVRVLLMDRALHHWILTAAGLSWVVGNVLMTAGLPIFDVAAWWLGFLTLTICAERLELNRLLQPTKLQRALFLVATGVFLCGAAVANFDRDVGFRLLGLGSLGLAAWLLRHDVARRTIRIAGATRYIAVALLGGYAWLAVGGVLALWHGNPAAGPVYDAMLHAFFVGFVFSMIFGHALIIVPAVLGFALPFKQRFYAHLALLHLSLVLRVVGDLLFDQTLRSWGAWINAAAIALFLVQSVTSARRLRRPVSAAPQILSHPTTLLETKA